MDEKQNSELEFIILDFDPFEDEDESEFQTDETGLLIDSKDDYSTPTGYQSEKDNFVYNNGTSKQLFFYSA